MPYFVYILRSQKDNKFYIGSTSDIEKRIAFHNAGLQRSTKNRTPFILIYKEELLDKSTALRREKQIKSFKGGNEFYKLINKWK